MSERARGHDIRAPQAKKAGEARAPFALGSEGRKILRKRLEQAVKRARRAGGSGGGVLAALTVAAAHDVDPSAVVFASRCAGEPWFCTEQPDRDRAAVAALGCVVALEARGAQRFEEVAARWRSL
ncbi:MAG: hypothetical protein M3376_01555, partial [Actinomycetota bacterium]|nr:hypothetical protein [Actinomycetota bacterium]